MRAQTSRLLVMSLVLLLATQTAACEREHRRFGDMSSSHAGDAPEAQSSGAGPDARLLPVGKNEYDENAWAVSEGKRVFEMFNCVGCHSHGGGNMGPALMDSLWIYGSEPDSIIRTIVGGRPNGMPAFGPRLVPAQLWQLTAYVRSLSGLTPIDTRAARDDHMSYTPSLQLKYNPENPRRAPQGKSGGGESP
jgi:cytochrome c oxidase cbb3-type subunit 3